MVIPPRRWIATDGQGTETAGDHDAPPTKLRPMTNIRSNGYSQVTFGIDGHWADKIDFWRFFASRQPLSLGSSARCFSSAFGALLSQRSTLGLEVSQNPISLMP